MLKTCSVNRKGHKAYVSHPPGPLLGRKLVVQSLALSGCLGIGSGQNLIGTIGTIFLALGLLPVSRFLHEHGAKSSLTHKILIVAGVLLLVG